MADKTTSTKILGVGLEYTDVESDSKKTAYLKIPNPRTNLTEEQIKNAVSLLLSGDEPILKDKFGNALDSATAIVTAYTESVETTEFDIGIE